MTRIVKKPEERKKEIVDAACNLFLKKGYHNTTMQDVMKELNIAKGTVYHYFKSKESLLDAVIEDIAESEFERLKSDLSNIEGSALQRLKYLIKSSSSPSVEEDTKSLMNDLHKVANAGMHIRLLARVLTMQAPLYAELFSQGVEEGIFKTESPLECAELILSGIQFLTDQGIYPWNEEDLKRRWLEFPKMMETLLGAPEGSFAFLIAEKLDR